MRYDHSKTTLAYGIIQIYHGLCPEKSFPKARYASVRTLYRPGSGTSEILDAEAMVLYFPAPRTVTGEDVLELHVHGGSATVKAVLSAIPSTAATSISSGSGGTAAREGDDHAIIRYAEPGEFTKRAFLNDRLDLAQVEALSATLAAETERQRAAAARGHSGSLGRAYEEWRAQLLAARAEMEALIDFSEDQHLEDATPSRLVRRVALHEDAGQRAELLRAGVRVALLGPPNAGKSSLMNRVVGREASIVSGESGTTRDIVEANLDIRGYLCTFADTAGFRTAAVAARTATASDGIISPNDNSNYNSGHEIGAVEREGIRRARAKALESDVIMVLASIEPDGSGGNEIRYDPETLRLAASSPQHIVLINKRDAVTSAEALEALVERFKKDVLGEVEGLEGAEPLLISCKEAEEARSRSGGGSSVDDDDPGGIRAVADHLTATFEGMTALPPALADLHGVTERQRQLLARCRAELEEYLAQVGYIDTSDADEVDEQIIEDTGPDVTVAAEHLRRAANCLGRITGRGDAGDVEEILGVIFEK